MTIEKIDLVNWYSENNEFVNLCQQENNETMNFDLIVKRIMSRQGFTDEKEVAKLFGLSAPDLSNRKKRGTLLPFVVDWAINEDVNLDWVLIGKTEVIVAEESPSYRKPDPVIEKINQHLAAMSEADRLAFEQIAATLAQSQRINKKAG